jgi:acylphosphatase
MAIGVGHRRIHLLIGGMVQGVSFRAGATDEARRLGLGGWVKNLDDGRVETVAEGPQEKLDGYLAWCRQGPAMAHVSDVRVEWGEATGEFKSFGFRR